MYLWIGLGIDKENENFIREYCREKNKKYEVNEQSFTLPQHISLKKLELEEKKSEIKSLQEEFNSINE